LKLLLLFGSVLKERKKRKLLKKKKIFLLMNVLHVFFIFDFFVVFDSVNLSFLVELGFVKKAAAATFSPPNHWQ